MKYDSSYVDYVYSGEELEKAFIKEFIRFRKENNLTQDVFAQFAGCSREKIARIESGMHSPSLLSMTVFRSIRITANPLGRFLNFYFGFLVCHMCVCISVHINICVQMPGRH